MAFQVTRELAGASKPSGGWRGLGGVGWTRSWSVCSKRLVAKGQSEFQISKGKPGQLELPASEKLWIQSCARSGCSDRVPLGSQDQRICVVRTSTALPCKEATPLIHDGGGTFLHVRDLDRREKGCAFIECSQLMLLQDLCNYKT